MGNIAKERESMEQASYPSYTLDALRARKETAAHRERQLCSIPPGAPIVQCLRIIFGIIWAFA